ncbi:MAG: IS1595 family transposase, partial [Desulfobacterales bacterium]
MMEVFNISEDFPKSEIEFDLRFSDPKACYQYLFAMKWPGGFTCKKCGNGSYWHSNRDLYICTKCNHQHSLTAGTIMDSSKKPITYWFKAMWWFTTRKSGVNAVNLKELLGLGSYQTAWSWLQKLRRCTIRTDREKLSGRVEVDEFVIGGRRSGKRGRGAEHKTIVVAAVEPDPELPEIGRIRLHVMLDYSSFSLETFIDENVEPGSTIVTDSWSSYPSIVKDQDHVRINQSVSGFQDDSLYGVHLVASLVKRLMNSTFQGRFEPKYLQNYLDEYVFRFNRRKSKYIGKKFMRIVQQVVNSVKLRCEDISWDIDPISEFFALFGIVEKNPRTGTEPP